MKSISTYVLIFIALVSSLLAWHHMIYTADTIGPFFQDEVANVQSAVSLFSSGRYLNDRFGLVYSSGIAVTWPAAIGWLIGKSMFASRVGCAFFSWLLSLGLGVCFLRREKYTTVESIGISVCLWAITITSPLALPYWFGFMYNLGELNSIILIGFGLLLLSRHQFLSVFIFGLAVWHGKIIYLPVAAAILVGNLLAQKLTVKRMLIIGLQYGLIFLLPLCIWFVWLVINGDINFWMSNQVEWFEKVIKMLHTPSATRDFSFGTLWRRFSSPELEWAGYSMGTKIKDLLFIFGAVGVTVIGLIMVRMQKLSISWRERWIVLMVTLGIVFYSVHYFLLHPFMWQRYLQPALYIGFGLMVFWAAKFMRRYVKDVKPVLCAVAIIVIVIQFAQSKKHPLFASGTSYARSCTDLYSTKCDSTLYDELGDRLSVTWGVLGDRPN